MKFIWPLILLLSLSVISCKKQEFKHGKKRLPKETQKGRGIFACYIDDVTYIARKQNAIVYSSVDGYLNLSNTFRNQHFRLFVYEGLYAEGIYAFDSTGEEFIRNYPYTVKSGEHNQLEITKLDLEEKIIAGRFSLDVFRVSNNKKVEIRDGRFDLKIHDIE